MDLSHRAPFASMDIIRKHQDVNARMDSPLDGFLQAVFLGDGMHLHIIRENDALVIVLLTQQTVNYAPGQCSGKTLRVEVAVHNVSTHHCIHCSGSYQPFIRN